MWLDDELNHHWHLRPFRAGDRMRMIHWSASAKAGQWYVREGLGSQTEGLTIIRSLQPSMNFGTRGQLKHCLAGRVALVWAFIAKRWRQPLSVVEWGQPCLSWKMGPGDEGLHRLTTMTVRGQTFEPTLADWSSALSHKKYVVFITDGYDCPTDPQWWQQYAARVTTYWIQDPLEQAWPSETLPIECGHASGWQMASSQSIKDWQRALSTRIQAQQQALSLFGELHRLSTAESLMEQWYAG